MSRVLGTPKADWMNSQRYEKKTGEVAVRFPKEEQIGETSSWFIV